MKEDRRSSLPIYILLLTIIIVVVYAFFIKPHYYLVNGGKVFLEPVASQKLSPLKEEGLFSDGESIYICTQDGLEKLDAAGTSIWNKAFYLDQPKLIGKDGYLAVAGMNSQKAYIFDSSGTAGTIDTEYPIILAGLSETGYLVLVQENGDSHQIALYNWKGEKVMQRHTRFTADGYPTAVAISPDSTRIVLSYAYFGNNVLETKLSFLDFSDKGKNYEDKIVGGHVLEGSLSPVVEFLDNGSLVVVSDNRIDFFDFEEVPSLVNTLELDDKVISCDVFDSSLMVRFGENAAPSDSAMANTITVFDSSGNISLQYETTEETIAVHGEEGFGYHLSSGKVEKLAAGKKLWEAQLHQNPEQIFELGKDRYLVVFRQSYDIYKIKDI